MTTHIDPIRTALPPRAYDAERGFALAATLLVMLVISALAIFFVAGGQSERQAGRAMLEGGRAFYASDAGLNIVLANMDAQREALDTLLTTTGDSVDLGWRDLEGGSAFNAVLTRTDPGDVRRMFSARVTGTGKTMGRSIQYMMLTAVPWDMDVRAPVEGAAERFEADKGGIVNGSDVHPLGWDAFCSALQADKPGVMWHHADSVEVRDSAQALGDPPIAIDPSLDPTNIFQWGTFDYDDIVAMADIIVPQDNAAAGQIKPQTTGQGECWYTPWKNWGDPQNPADVCGDYFPIIYRPGDLLIQNGMGAGQGILIIDGNLRIEDFFTFTGIVIVKGEFRIEDGVVINGAVITSNRTRLTDGAPLIQYSSCAVERSVLGAGLYTIQPVAERGWRQSG